MGQTLFHFTTEPNPVNQTRLFELTRRLISIPSLTGQEAAVTDFVGHYLADQHWHVSRQSVATDRFNILAYPDTPPAVLLCTHLDTVAPLIPLSEDADAFYGRGACDAKGIMAAMIETALDWQEKGKTGVGLLFVVGEEYDSIGARAANDWLEARAPFIVVGEPTENRLVIGQKGTLLLSVKSEGIAAHSAFPEQGQSAIYKLLDVINRLRAYEFPADSFFGTTTFNVGLISGGTKINVIPDQASAEIIFRLAQPVESVLAAVRDCVRDDAEFEIISATDPTRLKEVPGFETTIAAFGSDIPYFTHYPEKLLIGPGSIYDAHTDHEKITKQQLVAGVKSYINILHELIEK